MSSRGKEDERLAAQIEEYRTRFAGGPVGRWTSTQGTFDMIMGEEWEFRPDGSGRFEQSGYMSGARGVFSWRSPAPFQLELLVTYEDETQDGDGEDDGDGDGANQWDAPAAFDFRVVTHDAGSEVAIYFTPSLYFDGPLAYVGPCS